MEQIFNSLKSLVDPLVGKAAATLGENESRVSQAASGILSGLLVRMMSKGSNPQVENAVGDAAKANILPHLSAVFGTKGEVEQESIGNKMFRALMGDKTQEFTDAVSRDSGLSKGNTTRLINMISTAVAGFFGDRVCKGDSMANLQASLNNEKSSILAMLPAGVAGVLGYGSPAAKNNPPKKKGGMGWLIWLLAAIVLILLIIFGWRSCRDKKVVENVTTRTEQVANNAANAVRNTADNVARTLSEFTLPNGVKIQAYKNGMEDKMIAFLNSNSYKNAKTDADLSKQWFEFEEIGFARDSSTELESSATRQLNNITAVLKAYPEAKIKIGGNADKSGNRLYNMEISKERANTIKSLLVKQGIAANRISTEGFGDEHATWPASASESQSAADRDIAFRFTK